MPKIANRQIASAPESFYLALEALGSTVKAESLWSTLPESNTAQALADGTMRFQAIYIPKAGVITGVRWFQRTAGAYTGDNTNGIALYSYSGGTLTKVAETANTATIWTATANTFGTINFATPYTVPAPGIYFIAALYNNSAQTTAPAIAGHANLGNAAMVSGLLTNSAKIHGTLNAQTAFPATQAMSGITAGSSLLWFGLF